MQNNQYPVWKYLLVLAIILAGVVYALPNLYGEDPSIQVSLRSGELDPGLKDQVATALTDGNISFNDITAQDNRILVRFSSPEVQLRAKQVVTDTLGDNYVVALNLAPATPRLVTLTESGAYVFRSGSARWGALFITS